MTSTSFSSIQSQTSQSIASSIQAQMKEGQVIHGTIKQLFPNQMAEVQIGNQKIIAKLETPLKAGDAHFFQVTKSEPELQLKVVSGPLTTGNSISQQAQKLLQAMNLTKTTEMQAAIQFFLKEQIPISKELLVQVEQLLKQLPPDVSMKSALEAIQKMMELKIPLTKQLFESVISGKSTNGLLSIIDNFSQALQLDSSISSSTKNNLFQSLQKVAEPFRLPVAGSILGKLIEMIQNPQTSMSTKLSILQDLKGVAVLPSQATLTNLNPMLNQVSIPNSAGEFITQLLQSAPSEKVVVMEGLRNWVIDQTLLTSQQKNDILTLLKNTGQPLEVNNALVKVFAEQSQQAIFSKDSNGLSAKDHLISLLGKGPTSEAISQTLQHVATLSKNSNSIVYQQVIESEQTVMNQLNGKAFEHAMKDVLTSLGFSYEAKLSSNSEEVRQLASQLKPQLVELLQNQTISLPLKDQANQLLNRMNGLQILSSENGPQHQLLMQVPLEFLGKKMDATLEWNGRMKENGKIDSDFARIMFYLQLDSLEETVIDMQVQNRVVTISLFNNDTRLQPIANTFKDSLKDGLISIGYQLSGVFVKTFENHKLASQMKVKLPGIESQGVDIRI
ncbi:hypothetical protein [Psychrobacillus vulpis]|uniref:Uncharacterized protein n=1 Tax=Psychrobacillus vulpis TaxID=2325572 RepID=A0A544TTZ8_9BACI|nr:hypothetical protein [Psychrobacillus vulpis]TQR20904.1 hypothetical protein FG384_04735 [Psychrobacillus vulpis]